MLAFDSFGAGSAPIVVLLHGWPLNRSIWSEVAPTVAAAGFRVLAIDLPGFGESPPIAPSRASVEAYAAEVARAVVDLPAGQAAVAGHSFGGYVALALAEARPDLVSRLALIASRTGADSEAARRGRLETIEKVRAGGTEVLLPGLAERLVGPRDPAKWRPHARRVIERARPDGVMAGLAAMAARPDRTGVFEKFAGPRLVVHGAADALIPVAEAARPSIGAPAIRAILPDVGHMPMWESPERTADAIVAWAKEPHPGAD